MTDRKPIDDVLYLPFVFVPHGAPEPTEWRARHPEWVSFPATLRLPPSSQRRTTTDALSVQDIVPNTQAPGAPGLAGRRAPSRNLAHVHRFFNELHDPLTEAAQRLGIPPAWLMGLSSYESGWLDDHNTRLNNPLGLAKGGADNLTFRSRDEAIRYWESLYGTQVRGAQNPADFVGRLLGERDGQAVPGWRRYNSETPAWRGKVLEQIETIQRRLPLWRATQ